MPASFGTYGGMTRKKQAAKVLPGPVAGLAPVMRGDRVKALRLAKKWTQAELAHRAAITEKQLRDVEQGNRDLQLRGFRRLCIALGVSSDFLLGLDE